jgi:hypothetical protein
MASALDRNPDAGTRVAGSIEPLKISEATSLAFFAHMFCWCLAAGRDPLYPPDAVVRRLLGDTAGCVP